MPETTGERLDPVDVALEVADLTVRINTSDGILTVVDRVSFSLARNEILCIVGESGSGKSVTMLSAMRLMDERITDYDGQVNFAGFNLLTASATQMRQVRGSRMAMIFQDPMTALNPVYAVGWQISEQLRAHNRLSAADARSKAVDLLRMVGIADPEDRVDAYPHELSGGMRQRVMIALALSCRPQVLIADEPTTALDVTIQAQILQLISDLQAENGMSVVLVTHDMGVVAEMADRVLVMYGGRIIESGTAAEIFNNPQHPYTWGLLGSIPRLDLPKPARMPSIAGTPAAAGQPPVGCVFAPRCAHRVESCAEQPPLAPVSPSHYAACRLSPVERTAARAASLDNIGAS